MAAEYSGKPLITLALFFDRPRIRAGVTCLGMEEIVGHLQSEIEQIAPLLRAQAAEAPAPQVPAREA